LPRAAGLAAPRLESDRSTHRDEGPWARRYFGASTITI
jgi:hypothetical protein